MPEFGLQYRCTAQRTPVGDAARPQADGRLQRAAITAKHGAVLCERLRERDDPLARAALALIGMRADVTAHWPHNTGCAATSTVTSPWLPSKRLAPATLDNTTSTPTIQPPYTETSFLEPLNYSPASRSSSSPSTIDFTSVTTASHQSPWLSSPAPNANRQQLNTTSPALAHPQSDFVLYDQPALPRRAPSAPQPAHTFNNGQHFYANSAPSSTTEFQQPLSRQRPPVPLFHSSSNNIIPHPQLPNVANMADLNSNNSFDSGASLMPAFQAGSFCMDSVSAFTAINDPSVASGSTRTVSPKDIFADAFGSAPPSAAFTNLTSPDIDASPFINDSFETSPMFQGEPMLTSSNDWFSLFPEEENKFHEAAKYAPAVPLPMERTISSQSMERSGSSSTGSPIVLDSSSFRRKSSVTNSPATNGISKSRRRKGALPPIAVDPSDKVALKRARNTLAARESRQRKFDHVAELEARNAELQAEIDKWKNIALAHGYTGA
ncbi:hypothetical protein OPT61_g4186 [Boeremia exigua]|uniref:Uncharacterized protein n=1 Tax=Boeremia exigua TaxID=749465 RepID=A0ACC2IF26_9PLEO|nr:hypothetical protein OPT61_g4186 [Boeremia exigua]